MNDPVQIFQAAAANLIQAARPEYQRQIAAAVDLLVEAFAAGNKILVFGNGGSAADAEHICAELVVRFTRERRGLPAIALTSNPAAMTACGNDLGFERVFERQVEAYGKPGDVAWGISTSGNSPNVLAGLRQARTSGLRTIGLTGASGAVHLEALCDVLMAAPANETARIQEVHLVTYHAICEQIEERLFAAVDI